MSTYVLEWLNLLVRWFHLTAGIAWIGASFYFVWLDDHLLPPKDARDAENGVSGELWSVHGGGFYHNQKYLTGPRNEPLPQHLHWFKWEAYSTWISGMAMLAIVYWAGASTYMIDKNVLDLTPAAAIGISIASIVVGWYAYDALCRIFEKQPIALGIAVFGFLVLVSWALFHLFGARAAYIHVGSIIGTIMVANVAHVIIPGQRKMLAEIRAGKEPDPRPGLLGKTRSMHNTYFTLPVLFIMISNHYPMTYGSPYGWAVLAILALASILVREFYLLSHKDRFVPLLLAAAAVLVGLVALALAPRPAVSAGSGAVTFAQVEPIFKERCAVCHAAKPTQPGFDSPPLGVRFDTPKEIQKNAQRAFEQAVETENMPIGNATNMTKDERSKIGDWIKAGAKI